MAAEIGRAGLLASLLGVLGGGQAIAAKDDVCGRPVIVDLIKTGGPWKEVIKSDKDRQTAIQAIDVSVEDQHSDETGLRVRCSATIQVTEDALRMTRIGLPERDLRAYRVIESLEDNQGSSLQMVYLVTLSSDRKNFKFQVLATNDSVFPAANIQARLKRVLEAQDRIAGAKVKP